VRKALSETQEAQSAFNRKVAKGFELLFGRFNDMSDMVKSMHDQPVPNERRGNVRKSEVVERDFGTTDTSRIDGSEPISPLHNVELIKVQEALYQMCIKGEAGLDFLDVTKFENSRGNFSILSSEVIKRLEKRFCSSAEAA
jgi:hypothetical protein